MQLRSYWRDYENYVAWNTNFALLKRWKWNENLKTSSLFCDRWTFGVWMNKNLRFTQVFDHTFCNDQESHDFLHSNNLHLFLFDPHDKHKSWEKWGAHSSSDAREKDNGTFRSYSKLKKCAQYVRTTKAGTREKELSITIISMLHNLPCE